MAEKSKNPHGCSMGTISKLNTADIKQIRALDELTEKELANRYGVSKSTIGLIRRRERWAHV